MVDKTISDVERGFIERYQHFPFEEKWIAAERAVGLVSGEIDKEKTRETHRSSWGALSLLFRLYESDENWPIENGPSRFSIPRDVARYLADVTADLRNGLIVDAISLCQTQGRPPKSRFEQQAEYMAVAYIWLAKAGRVKDSRPFATVANDFGVDKRSVSRWIKEARENGRSSDNFLQTTQDLDIFLRNYKMNADNYHKNGRGTAKFKPKDSKPSF